MWGKMLRKRRQGSVEGAEWPGGLPAGPAEPEPLKAARLDRFKQQTLASYTLTFSPRLVIASYLATALLFLPLGAAILAGSANVRDTPPLVYNAAGQCRAVNGPACRVTFEVPRRIPAPSYLFYIVTNLHQNYREYVKSRSGTQLRGVSPTTRAEVRDCDPLLYKPAFAARPAGFVDNKANPFRPAEVLNPCGLTAASYFRDTLTVCKDSACDATFAANRTGIAWASDRKYKFRPGPAPHYNETTNKLLQDEGFMVWMRLSAFSRAQKLYARITEDIPAGTYTMSIDSQFPAHVFGGEKLFFISNTMWFGAKNVFLGVLYVTTGAVSLFVALVVLGTHVLYPRPPAHFNPDLIRRELAKLSLEYA